MNYKVGDKVRVKTWNELKEIGSEGIAGDIVKPDGWNLSFLFPMKEYCGKEFEIKQAFNNDESYALWGVKNEDGTTWFFEDWMLEPVKEPNHVNHPDHYNKCSIECIDMMECVFGERNTSVFAIVNAFKYIWRFKFKNGLEDLNKAKWYLDYASNNWEYLTDNEHNAVTNLKALLNKMKKETYGEEMD